MGNRVTRFNKGVTNANRGSALEQLPFPDPTKYHVFMEDFDNFEADQWVITTTEAGAGSATEAVADEDGGILVVTNDAADDDADFFQWSGDDDSGAAETFKFIAGKQLWFKSRFKVSDATQSDFVMGLQIADTTPLDVTDGVYFTKADGSTSITLKVEKDDTATTSTVGTCGTSYMTLGFHYDGVNKIHYYMDDAYVGTSATTNLPDDEELTISFGIQNGEAVAKVMSVDYIFVAKER